MPALNTVLLINPPSGLYRRDDRCQNRVEDQTAQVILPPMDLLYTAAILEQQGIECRIRDFPAEGLGEEALAEELRSRRYDALILSITAPTIHRDLAACQLAKNLQPHLLTVAFGAFFLKFARQTLEECPELDLAISGEPERSFLALAGGVAFADIPAATFRENEGIVETPSPKIKDELDTYPFPARHLIQSHLYLSPDTHEPITVVQTSRGCPYDCIYCPAKVVSGARVRYRSPENILAEIEECVERYGIRYFLFGADTFTMNKKWVKKLCGLIREKALPIRWAANSRVDTVDLETFRIMKEAGCHIVGFGVESGDPGLLVKMKKDITLDKTRAAIRMCKEAGLKVHTFYVLGLPWETRESVARTVAFARELDADFFDFNIAFPLPGTEYYDIAVQEGLIEGSVEGLGYASSPVHTHDLSRDDLVRLRTKAMRELTFRPRYILRTLWREKNDPKVLLNYLKFGMKRARQLMASSPPGRRPG